MDDVRKNVEKALYDLWYLRRDPIAEGTEDEPTWDYVFRLCIETVAKAAGIPGWGKPPAWPPTLEFVERKRRQLP